MVAAHLICRICLILSVVVTYRHEQITHPPVTWFRDMAALSSEVIDLRFVIFESSVAN